MDRVDGEHTWHFPYYEGVRDATEEYQYQIPRVADSFVTIQNSERHIGIGLHCWRSNRCAEEETAWN